MIAIGAVAVVAISLNAPTGAWCSLTLIAIGAVAVVAISLNAPTGAWCSLTSGAYAFTRSDAPVSMHLHSKNSTR